MRLRVAFGVGGVIAAITACQLIAGIDDRKIYDAAVTGDGAVDPCLAPDIPPAPALNTSSPTDNVTFVAALSKVMLGTTDGGPYYGFNLDKTCTCTGASGDSCQRPPSTKPACDDPSGVDNYARHAFEQINALGSDGGFITEEKFNSAVQTGLSGALIEVSSYNGQKDDGVVSVTVYASQGYDRYPDAGPSWDGGDQWILDPSSSSGQFSTSNAYVSNYTLVAQLSFPIIVGSATTQPVTIQLEAGLIRADLQMNGKQLVKMTNGQIGGRWDPGKFLPSLQAVPDPTSPGQFLCGTDFVYEALKAIICNNVDVNISPAYDGTGICNAVSMGLGFEALPAQKGKTGAAVDAGAPCGPNWTDKCPQ
jgi:hypothetical protein